MFTKSARFYDAIYAFKDYAAEAARVHELIQQRAPGAETLLDVACGTGKHLELLRDQYRGEGLDLDPELLAIAQGRNRGVRFHHADMVDFDLGVTFDALICLFSSIGYVRTVDRLRQTMGNFARHLRPGGVLIVEPWLPPDAFIHGHLGSAFVDEPDLKIARMNTARRDGSLSVLDFAYLVGTPAGIEHFTERHVLGLFTTLDHLAALDAAGFDADHDPEGLMGRGLYIGVRRAPIAAPSP